MFDLQKLPTRGFSFFSSKPNLVVVPFSLVVHLPIENTCNQKPTEFHNFWRSIIVVVTSIFVVVSQIEHVLGGVIVVCVFIATLNYIRPKEKVVLVRKQSKGDWFT